MSVSNQAIDPTKAMLLVLSYSHGFSTGFPVTPDEGKLLLAGWAAHRKFLDTGWFFRRPKPFVLRGDDWAADTTGVVSVRLIPGFSLDGGNSDADRVRAEFERKMMTLQLKMAEAHVQKLKRQQDDPFGVKDDDDDYDDDR